MRSGRREIAERCAARRNARRAGRSEVEVRGSRRLRALAALRLAEGLIRSWAPVPDRPWRLVLRLGAAVDLRPRLPRSGARRPALWARANRVDALILVSTDRGRRTASAAARSGLGGVPLLLARV